METTNIVRIERYRAKDNADTSASASASAPTNTVADTAAGSWKLCHFNELSTCTLKIEKNTTSAAWIATAKVDFKQDGLSDNTYKDLKGIVMNHMIHPATFIRSAKHAPRVMFWTKEYTHIMLNEGNSHELAFDELPIETCFLIEFETLNYRDEFVKIYQDKINETRDLHVETKAVWSHSGRSAIKQESSAENDKPKQENPTNPIKEEIKSTPTTSLFGTTAPATGSLFGASTTGTTVTSSLFGATIAATKNAEVPNKPTETTAESKTTSTTTPATTPAPFQQTPAVVPAATGSLFAAKTNQGGWKCEVCLVKNKDGDTKCVSCETPRPGASNAAETNPVLPAAATATPTTAGFSFAPKTNQGGWKCNVCLVKNKDGDVKCVSCESPRAGAPASTPQAPAAPATTFNGFSFSANGTTTTASPFTLGKPSDPSKPSLFPTTATTTAMFGAQAAPTTAADPLKTVPTLFGGGTGSGFSLSLQSNPSEAKPLFGASTAPKLGASGFSGLGATPAPTETPLPSATKTEAPKTETALAPSKEELETPLDDDDDVLDEDEDNDDDLDEDDGEDDDNDENDSDDDDEDDDGVNDLTSGMKANTTNDIPKQSSPTTTSTTVAPADAKPSLFANPKSGYPPLATLSKVEQVIPGATTSANTAPSAIDNKPSPSTSSKSGYPPMATLSKVEQVIPGATTPANTVSTPASATTAPIDAKPSLFANPKSGYPPMATLSKVEQVIPGATTPANTVSTPASATTAQVDTKPGIFGSTSSPVFGQPGFGTFAQAGATQTPSLFNQPKPSPFGSTTTPAFGKSGFEAFAQAGATQTPSLFNQPKPSPFGPTTTPAFGKSGFGTSTTGATTNTDIPNNSAETTAESKTTSTN